MSDTLSQPGSPTLLVDGTAMAYRAFFAIRSLSTKAGRPTNAVFGFARMLSQLRAQWSPGRTAMVFDGGLPRERMAMLPTYKAQREPMPGDLRVQLEDINRLVTASGLPLVRIEGQEADDVLATLAERAAPDGHVLIATSDKDLYQLVNDRIALVPLAGDPQCMDAEAVKNKTGVAPDQIPSWLALTGDTADNIPGVPGVGPKTAAKLLQQFGTIEALYRAIDAVPSDKLRAALFTCRDRVERNRSLVLLRRDLEVHVEWPPDGRRADTAALAALYEELELHSLLRELREPRLF